MTDRLNQWSANGQAPTQAGGGVLDGWGRPGRLDAADGDAAGGVPDRPPSSERASEGKGTALRPLNRLRVPCVSPGSSSERMNGSPRVGAATPVPMSAQVRMGLPA
ncbi:hypothetical protein GCM10009579_71560 [Streptomyces javensis]|uniref:Uncharacterized protein n=1 Tax=Streptomyces javensis TaxID=114698 RepID=A0ABN1XAY5_9ACTN